MRLLFRVSAESQPYPDSWKYVEDRRWRGESGLGPYVGDLDELYMYRCMNVPAQQLIKLRIRAIPPLREVSRSVAILTNVAGHVWNKWWTRYMLLPDVLQTNHLGLAYTLVTVADDQGLIRDDTELVLPDLPTIILPRPKSGKVVTFNKLAQCIQQQGG